jgi:cardiolipin synthase A/B
MKRKISTTIFLALFGLAWVLYAVLVTPRRFFQCLSAPVRYLTRQYGEAQQASVLPAAQPGNRARLLVNGDAAFPAVLQMLDSARESIRWQVMLFQPDEAGFALAEGMAAAARRGVRVQLSFNIDQTVNGTIADGFSSEKKEQNRQAMDRMLALLREAGAEVRENPAGIDFPLQAVDPASRAIQQDIQRSACISVNHYDHRKLLIVDNRQALAGGMNVSNQYLYRIPPELGLDMRREARQRLEQDQPEAWDKWLDAAIVLEGPVVAEFVAEFNWKWSVLGGTPLPGPEALAPFADGLPVQFLAQRPGTQQVGARFFELAARAEREIYVASPFVSYEPALEALRAASRRGVRVVFVFPNERNEMEISRQIFLDSADSLRAAGVELYFNDLRMTHTKLLVVDGRQVLLGSFNLNHRSFRHDNEAAVLITDEAFADQVIQQIFQPYLQISRPVNEPLDRPWSLWRWLLKPFT